MPARPNQPQTSSLARQAATQVDAVTLPEPGAPAKSAMRAAIDQYRPIIAKALPAHMTEEAFVSTILTAVRSTPKLLQCDPASLVGAAVKAAQLGLVPNDPRQLCALIPRWNRNLYGEGKGGMEATYQTEYRGAIELARRSGFVHRIVARTVYQGDVFSWAYGLDEHLTHEPTRDAEDRGPAWAWYAVAWDTAGTMLDFQVLLRPDVEYHRGFAGDNSPAWSTSYDAMARKTAVWELMRLLPQSPEVAAAMAADDHVVRLGDDGEADPVPQPIGRAEQVPSPDDDVQALEAGEDSPTEAASEPVEAPATDLPPVPDRGGPQRPEGGAKARAVAERHASATDTTGEVTDGAD